MTIYSFVIYMFFICVLGKNAFAINVKSVGSSAARVGGKDDYIKISESKVSNLPLEPLGGTGGKGIETYRFLGTPFNEKLFAFQRTNSLEGSENKMFVWTSADNGITWKQESKIPCTIDTAGGPCEVMSTMIFDKELVVIYGNKSEFVIATSEDGITWKTGVATGRDTMKDKTILYYEGIPSDLPTSVAGKKNYIVCYETVEEPTAPEDKEYVTVAACSTSIDEGKVWKTSSFLRVKKEITNLTKLDQVYFFEKSAFFIAKFDTKEHVLFVCEPLAAAKADGAVMHCEAAKEEGSAELASIFNVGSDKKSMSLIFKVPIAYVLVHIGQNGPTQASLLEIKGAKPKVVKRDLRSEVTPSSGKKANVVDSEKPVSVKTEVDGTLPIMFHIAYISETHISIMYEYNKEILNISGEFHKRKPGCLFVKEDPKDPHAYDSIDIYTHAVLYKELESDTDKVCPLDNIEPTGDETFISFFVTVPEVVDFENSENCFKHSFVEEEKTESRTHQRSVIHIKNVVTLNENAEEKMKEIEFVYPASLHSLMKYNKKLICTSTNFKFEIAYNFKEDTDVVKKVKFETLVKDFTVEANRVSLGDYKWNDSVPETAIGSYVIDSANYMKRFQVYVDLLNNTSNAIADFTTFQTNYPKEMEQLIAIPDDQKTKDYEGIDFTNSSKHYEALDSEIDEDKTIPVKVVVPAEGKIVGLLCPLENAASLDELKCFDVVSDLKDNALVFEELFDSVPFHISPKIMIYNQKLMAVESLLHLNEESYNALEGLTKAIHFKCVCKVKTYSVTVQFSIGTSSSDFEIEEGGGGGGEEDPDKKPDKGISTRNVLSSAVVLLVLLNVFSCISFLN